MTRALKFTAKPLVLRLWFGLRHKALLCVAAELELLKAVLPLPSLPADVCPSRALPLSSFAVCEDIFAGENTLVFDDIFFPLCLNLTLRKTKMSDSR
jgi:hypothetical protein